MNCLCRSSKTISVRIVLLDETDFLHELKHHIGDKQAWMKSAPHRRQTGLDEVGSLKKVDCNLICTLHMDISPKPDIRPSSENPHDDLPGQSILDIVFSRLNLIETAYFGIRYLDQENQTHWLDPAARISRQIKTTTEPFDLYFGVKFYAADPCKLLEEITRYQLFLQVKQDVLQGRLPVSFELAAELGAYVVQSELGDYDQRRHSPGYVSEFRLVTNQSRELELRVSELHHQLKGMTPSNAELNYLDKVKWHDLYGVDLHPVLGEDSVEYFLGLTPSGIVVLRNKTTVAHYYWPRIAKVYFKGRYFMLRVCDKNNEVSTYGFETPRKSACKHLWKCCVEHHAFFRLVRAAPMQSPTGPSDLFALGSRFRYSGRTEKQAVRDAISQSRQQPTFTRTPSKRQPRRMQHLDHTENKSIDNTSTLLRPEIKAVSIPQPAQANDSPYRSTTSIPAQVNGRTSQNGSKAPDSPRSTRSAPWARSQQRGLFGITSSPRSVRSVSTRGGGDGQTAPSHRQRSSSVESHSSNESRPGRRHRHRSKRHSDNESELSRGSGRSGRSHNSHRKHRRQRSKHRRNDSGSEADSTRARSYSGHRVTGEVPELVDSGNQWREVQRRQAESYGVSSVQQASVTKSTMAAKPQSENEGYHTNPRNRKHRKHRSPSDRSKIWSSELAKHLQFGLVDTAGMTEDQLREIPYTVVETHHSNTKRAGTNSLKVHKNSQTKDRVDRIRGIYLKDSNESSGQMNGSIRSASTVSSTKDCDKNAGLVRIMSSMSMGDFISPSGSSLSPLDGSGLRVSHEHTDSGLGADQDYAYSSERSSDSTKYGTNKSSGASVTSNGHTNNRVSHLSSSATQLHSVSNRKPPLHPSRQQQHPQSHHQLIKSSTPAPPVHNSSTSSSTNNNRLLNNTIFQNNQYTFSLSRISGNYNHSLAGDGVGLSPNGYLETRPLSSASIHGDGTGVRYINRGTKSDIGVPVRRPSSSASVTNGNHHYYENNYIKKTPSVSSDLISYINSASSHNNAFYAAAGSRGDNKGGGALTTSSDYLENYRASKTHFYSCNSRKSQTNFSSTFNNQSLGPLVYLETDNFNNQRNMNAKYFQSLKNNPNSNNMELPGVMSTCITAESGGGGSGATAAAGKQKKIVSTSSARSTSLELILTPIIQSSRRAQ